MSNTMHTKRAHAIARLVSKAYILGRVSGRAGESIESDPRAYRMVRAARRLAELQEPYEMRVRV